MNSILWIMYRTARKMMSKDQTATAMKLARMADEGDTEAQQTLHALVMEILFNHKGRKGKRK